MRSHAEFKFDQINSYCARSCECIQHVTTLLDFKLGQRTCTQQRKEKEEAEKFNILYLEHPFEALVGW